MREEVFSVVYGWIFRAILCFIFIHIDASHKQEVAPYLLPAEHPIRPMLDALFMQSRAILNLETLHKAGFKKTKPRKFTKLIVTSHPSVPGYIFKLYLDAQRYHKDTPEHHFWIARVQGANLVRQYIKDHHLGDRFKVPQKWIYNLPSHPKTDQGYQKKNYILVEEDMMLFPDQDNKNLWSSDYVTYQLLEELYGILKFVGLYDAAKPDNIPFSLDGKIAFIDTQTYNEKNVRYEKLTPYLSASNKEFWKMLTNID